MKIFITYIMLAFALNNVTMAHASAVDSWQIIGTTQLKFTTDHDGIVVKAPNNSFQSIKLKVTGTALRLIKLVITFDSGAPDNIELINDIPNGGESDAINLSGIEDRKIKKIDFWYDTQGILKGKASVTILGKN